MDGAGLHPRDFRTAEDLAKLPLTTGNDLALLPDGNVVHALMVVEEILTVPGVVQVQVRQQDVVRFSLLVVCTADCDWHKSTAALKTS